jgi:hypothetical protein
MACLDGKTNLTTERKACIIGMFNAGRTNINKIFKQSKACGMVKAAKKSCQHLACQGSAEH